MAFIRKIKASLVRLDIEDYVGESTYIFYDIVSGELRIFDGTPGGTPIFVAGGGITTVQDEGIDVSTASTLLNFAGTGVTVTEPGPAGELLVTIPSSGSDLEIEDEAISLTAAATLINFAGAGVTATEPGASGEILVTIPGGSAGASIQLDWKFSTAIDNSDPGNKTFKYDNVTLASVTNIYVNDTTNSNADAGFILSLLKAGNKIYIQETSNSVNNVLFEVSGDTTDNGGWFTIPVTVDDSATLHGNNQNCGWLIFGAGGNNTVWGDITGTLSDQTDLQTALDAKLEEEVFAQQIDFITDDLLYRGEAEPGTATSDPLWRIRRITIDSGNEGDISTVWADGDNDFNNVWDDRLGLSYS